MNGVGLFHVAYFSVTNIVLLNSVLLLGTFEWCLIIKP